MNIPVALARINVASSANTAKTLSLSAGASQKVGYYGHILRPILCVVSWSASVTGKTISATLDSGLGSTYDATLVSESFAGQYWVWSVQDALPGFCLLYDDTSSGTIVADELDLTAAAGGAGVISYLTIYFEVLE